MVKVTKKLARPEAGKRTGVIQSIEEVSYEGRLKPRIEVTFRFGDGEETRQISKTYDNELRDDSSLGELLAGLGYQLDKGDEFDLTVLIAIEVAVDIAPMSGGVYVAGVSKS